MGSAGDVQKMIAVGLVWGATNAIMRRGALIWENKLRSAKHTDHTNPSSFPPKFLKNWINLIFTWQYSVPFLINISASAAFFAILGHCPISLAVPVTNATSFAATAVTAIILGEKTRLGFALIGTLSMYLGIECSLQKVQIMCFVQVKWRNDSHISEVDSSGQEQLCQLLCRKTPCERLMLWLAMKDFTLTPIDTTV